MTFALEVEETNPDTCDRGSVPGDLALCHFSRRGLRGLAASRMQRQPELPNLPFGPASSGMGGTGTLHCRSATFRCRVQPARAFPCPQLAHTAAHHSRSSLLLNWPWHGIPICRAERTLISRSKLIFARVLTPGPNFCERAKR